MVDQALLESLSDEMRQILDAEVEAGNEISETYQGGFSKVTDDHVFVFLRRSFTGQYNYPGITYVEVGDPHYWKAEYDDEANHQTIACGFSSLHGACAPVNVVRAVWESSRIRTMTWRQRAHSLTRRVLTHQVRKHLLPR